MITYNDIRDLIDNYHWIIKEVDRMRKELDAGEGVRTGVSTIYSDKTGVKGSGRSDRIFKDVSVRERQFRRLEKLEQKADLLVSLIEQVDLSFRDMTFLELLLEGTSISKAATSIGVSRRSGGRVLEKIINQMLETVKQPVGENRLPC